MTGAMFLSTFHAYLGKQGKWLPGRMKIIVYQVIFLGKKLICRFSWLISLLFSSFCPAPLGIYFILFYFLWKTSWVRRDFILKTNDHINKVTADKLKVTLFSAGETCSLLPNCIFPPFIYSPFIGGWQAQPLMDSEEITERWDTLLIHTRGESFEFNDKKWLPFLFHHILWMELSVGQWHFSALHPKYQAENNYEICNLVKSKNPIHEFNRCLGLDQIL